MAVEAAPGPAEYRRPSFDGALAVLAPPVEDYANELRLERIRAARIKGYEATAARNAALHPDPQRHLPQMRHLRRDE
jgi:hypothetical protein